MAINLEQTLNNAGTVLRGEVSGSVKFLIIAIVALSVLVGVSLTNGMIAQSETSLKSQQGQIYHQQMEEIQIEMWMFQLYLLKYQKECSLEAV